jgi:predicted GTPase
LFYRYKKNTSDPSKKVRAIIMGECGNGKSSLLNNVCGTKIKAGEAKGSMTRDLS